MQAIGHYEELLAYFPSSPYVQCQLAHARYNLREFDDAQAGFEALLKRDPYRLDQVDTYSNILYVKESKRALSSWRTRASRSTSTAPRRAASSATTTPSRPSTRRPSSTSAARSSSTATSSRRGP